MPNWCEGVMKLRGTKDNILRFLKEGFEPSYKNSAIEIDEFGEEVNIIDVNYMRHGIFKRGINCGQQCNKRPYI